MTDLLTNGIISIDTYQYSNNNWKDQLSNYNGESIIYDGLGNLIKIRNNITMNWITGRSLNGYIGVKNGVQVNYESSNIGLINSFRYRSYYYDSEIKVYYLNSRY